METRFKTLRLFAGLHVAIGTLLLVCAVLLVLVMAGVIAAADERVTAMVAGSAGVFEVITLTVCGIAVISYGQIMQVLVQIEENTRKD